MDKSKSECANTHILTVRVASAMESEYIITQIEVVSLDEKLIDVCRRANGTNPVILFNSYYTNSFLLYINGVGIFPYILRNGEFEWLVPFTDVTITEFLHTHNIQLNDGINIENGIPETGGLGFIGAIETWEKVWPIINGNDFRLV